MSKEYRQEQNERNNRYADAILDQMPGYVIEYYISMRAKRLQSRTILAYLYELQTFFSYICENCAEINDFHDITPEFLGSLNKRFFEAYLVRNSKKGQELAASSISREVSSLKNFYKDLYQSGQIPGNPMELVEKPKDKENRFEEGSAEKRVIKLEKVQVQRLLDVIQSQAGASDHSVRCSWNTVLRDYAIMMTFLGTGMRLSELVGLNVNDFDPVVGCFYVIRKGGTTDRVYFGDEVEDAVYDYLENGRPLLLPPEDENALFLSRQHKRLTTRAIQNLTKKYAAAAGLPDNISPHKMRATFATNLYEETKDIYMVKDALNHASLETSKKYIGDKEARKREAGTVASSLFN